MVNIRERLRASSVAEKGNVCVKKTFQSSSRMVTPSYLTNTTERVFNLARQNFLRTHQVNEHMFPPPTGSLTTQQLNRTCPNLTKPRSPSLKRWVFRWSAAKKRCSLRGTATRRLQWNGFSLTWRTQAGFSRYYSGLMRMYAYVDIDAPIGQAVKGGQGPEPSPEQIGMLADMGFTIPQARKALRETVCGLNVVQFPAAL